MEKATMTVNDVAVYIGIHSDTVYDMVRRKDIPHFRVGRKILFSKDTIEQWILDEIKKDK